MERRRGATASGARSGSRLPCGEGSCVPPCGVERRELNGGVTPLRQDSLCAVPGGRAQAQPRTKEKRSRSDPTERRRSVCRRPSCDGRRSAGAAREGAVAGTRRSTLAPTSSRAVRPATAGSRAHGALGGGAQASSASARVVSEARSAEFVLPPTARRMVNLSGRVPCNQTVETADGSAPRAL